MKPTDKHEQCEQRKSPPARGRGLKLSTAPLAADQEGRPPRGGVD